MAHSQADAETIEALDAPSYSLAQTMSGWRLGGHDPAFRLDAREVRFGLTTPAGAVGLRARQRPEGVMLQAFGPGSEWAVVHARTLLGLHDAAHHFDPAPGPIRDLVRRYPGMRLPRLPVITQRLVQIVLLQLVAFHDAMAVWTRLVRGLGEPAPGGLDVWLAPTPSTLCTTSTDALVALGLSYRQARTIRAVAAAAPRLEAVIGDRSKLRARLGALPGIGQWSIAYLEGGGLGAPDALLLGDYNLPRTVAWLLAGEPRGDDARLVELMAPYAGHRFRVIRLLWAAGIRVPRRGPRLARRRLAR